MYMNEEFACRQQAEEMSANATAFLPAEYADRLFTQMRGKQSDEFSHKKSMFSWGGGGCRKNVSQALFLYGSGGI